MLGSGGSVTSHDPISTKSGCLCFRWFVSQAELVLEAASVSVCEKERDTLQRETKAKSQTTGDRDKERGTCCVVSVSGVHQATKVAIKFNLVSRDS